MTSALEVPTGKRLAEIRAVCLDVDDTLLDNERSSRRGLAALTGTDVAWPEWRRLSDEHYARMLAGEFDFDSMRRERTRAFFESFGEQLSDAEVVSREQQRLAAVERAWQLFDDAVPCLEWLRASGLRVAVITNAPGEYQRRKLASVGLAGAFDEFLSLSEAGAAKPEPSIFTAACSALNLAPAQVAHVGDRLDLDAMGAARAGMHGIWLNRGGHEVAQAECAAAGVAIITSLDDLPETLVCAIPDATVVGEQEAFKV